MSKVPPSPDDVVTSDDDGEKRVKSGALAASPRDYGRVRKTMSGILKSGSKRLSYPCIF